MTSFGRNEKFVKSICKVCDSAKYKKVRGAAQASLERALYLQEGRDLAEAWFADRMQMFRQSMQPLGVAFAPFRRWNHNTSVTPPSICRFYELPAEAAEDWPLQYRDMVLKATGSREVLLEQFGSHYKFGNDGPLPGPGDSARFKEFLRNHMDPSSMTIELV